MSFLDCDFVAFDTETTGVDVVNDRIVSASCVRLHGREVVASRDWLVNADVDIPTEASAVHGITTERMRAEGIAPAVALREIASALQQAWTDNCIVVVMNAPFDLHLLQHELQRNDLPKLKLGTILDPLVLDRFFDRYRSGPRTLGALALRYGVTLTEAHTSRADAIAAGLIGRELVARHMPTLERLENTAALNDFQQRAYAAWAENFARYLRQQRRPVNITPWPT